MSESEFTKSTTVVAAEHTTSAEVEDETVILDLQEGLYYELNSTGSHIWKEIKEPIPIGRVVSTLTEEYEIGSEECLEEVISLLQDMEKNGLIEVE
ncbi:PqqD family peptide modification chaperone [Salinibacter ruber]|jgi:hypothetical protein|nr:PqqD family peptide modification chaperone [Salinibacter ruber]